METKIKSISPKKILPFREPEPLKWFWRGAAILILIFGFTSHIYASTIEVNAEISGTQGGILCSQYGDTAGRFDGWAAWKINMDGTETSIGSGGNNGCSSGSISPINTAIESAGIQISKGIHITNGSFDVTAHWVPNGSGGYVSELGTDLSTHIETITPNDSSTIATSSSYTIGSTGAINSTDFNYKSKLKIHLENSANSFKQCADVICAGIASNAVTRDFEYDLTTASPYSYSSTTIGLPIGTYYMHTTIVTGNFCFLGICVTTKTLTASSTSFTIATTTKVDKLKEDAKTYLQTLGNTGENTFQNCGIADFNLFTCGSDLVTWAFVPTPDALDYFANTAHDNIITHFPLGYVTDFISILATSTVGSITPIDAVLPPGIPGTGAHIRLDLSHSIDFLLNATSSTFNNESASSTETFYQITSVYWNWLIYLGTAMYMLGRIIAVGKPKYKEKIS